MNENKTLNIYKVIATLFIIMIHTQHYLITTKIPYLIMWSLIRLAVPIFFMISGFLMFNKLLRLEDNFMYIKTYILRLVKIYFIYTVCDYLFLTITNQKTFNILSLDTVYNGHTESTFYQLWFLLALIYSTMTVYMMRKKITSLLIVSFSFNIFGYFLYTIDSSIVVRDYMFLGLFYTTLGYFIGENKEKILDITKKFSIKICLLIIVLLLILNYFELNYMYKITPVLNDYNMVGAIISFMLFLVAIKNEDLFKNNYISKKGRKTFSVFLFHTVIITFIDYLVLKLNIDLKFEMLTYVLFNVAIYVICDYIISIFKNIIRK